MLWMVGEWLNQHVRVCWLGGRGEGAGMHAQESPGGNHILPCGRSCDAFRHVVLYIPERGKCCGWWGGVAESTRFVGQEGEVKVRECMQNHQVGIT
jgi:hypothetical protein